MPREHRGVVVGRRSTRGSIPDGEVPVDIGDTRYVRSGHGHVAYQVLSTGSADILVVNESVLPIEALHDNPHTASYLRRLATWGRVIVFDRRGVGLSDSVPVPERETLRDRVADAIAVLDAVGSEQAAVFSSGPSSGLLALSLAAEHPERVSFLSVYDAIARYRWAPDYPWGVSAELDDELATRLHATWGTPRFADRRGRFAATAARHPGFVEWATTWFRRSVGPTTNAAQATVLRTGDVRAALPAIACPTLVINHADVGDGRYLADHIDGARYVELRDPCHLMFSPELDEVLSITGELFDAPVVEPAARRVLTTLLCTDVIGSATATAASDERGGGVTLATHSEMVRRQIERFDGREVVMSIDGLAAAFDAPTRAVECALAIRQEAARGHVATRFGVHTGEVEIRGGHVLGLGPQVARRLCALAAGEQVLVSRQVADLSADSGLRFDHLGDHPLKGLPGRWSVFEASAPPPRLLDPTPTTPAPPVVNGRPIDLSPREAEVLAVLATGASNAEIASALFMSEATVKAHVSHLFVKLGYVNRVQLALYAHRSGLADA
ncbi:MAG: LuxR C-terminal-related transcriptional regulator [Ilumatobacteraceae bacterium]